MEEENDWAVSNLGETDICVLGKHYTDKHVRLYRIKVPDPEACLPPSYFSSPLFKLKSKLPLYMHVVINFLRFKTVRRMNSSHTQEIGRASCRERVCLAV